MTKPPHASPPPRGPVGTLVGSLVLALLLLAQALPALAQQQPPDIGSLSLEELMAVEVDVVYAASRYQQKLQEAPASVTVITSDEIRARGFRTLAAILASAPGLYVTNDRNYSFLGVRGFARPGDYNSRVLLLVNGHRLNDNIYDQASIGTEFPIDVSVIERVEVIRGPNSSLYGTSAFLAVVNVITKTGRGLPALTMSGEAGSLGTASGQVMTAWADKAGRSLLLSASGYASDGADRWYDPAFDAPGTGDGIALDADRDTAGRFFASFTTGNLSVQAAHGTRHKRVPTAAWGTIFGDARFVTKDLRTYLNAQYVRQLKGYTVTGRAHVDSYSYSGQYPYGQDEDTILNVDKASGRWWGIESWITSPPGRAHRFSLGTQVARHIQQDQVNADEGAAPTLDDHRRSTDVGLYAQSHSRLGDTFILDASLRYDRHGRGHDTLSPRIALIHDPTAATSIKAIYGRVFRYPNAYEQYYADASTQKVNPGLHPETVNTWELLVDRRITSCFRLAVGGFLSRFSDLINEEVDPSDGLTFFDNMESLSARGLEVEAEAKNAGGRSVGRLSYSLQWATDRETGESVTNAPRHLVKGSAWGQLPWWRLTAGGGFEYASSRLTRAGAATESMALVSLQLLRRDLLPGLDATLNVQNLFNARYGDPASAAHHQDAIAQDGRTVMLRLSYRVGR